MHARTHCCMIPHNVYNNKNIIGIIYIIPMIPKLPQGTYFTKSTRKNKKYTAHLPTGKKVHFGDSRYDHYYDNVPINMGGGIWSHLDHLDRQRRKAYRARHSKIRTRDGEQAYKVKYSPSWFSYWFLW